MGHSAGVNEGVGLPNGVEDIIQYLARMARGYDNHLKWNEVAKLKADLMNATDRWLVIDPADVRERAVELGMRSEDADEISDLIQRRKQRKRLVPTASYREYRFLHPVTVYPESYHPSISTSTKW